MLGIEYDPRRLDATDGMAVALCHHFITSSPVYAVGRAGGAQVDKLAPTSASGVGGVSAASATKKSRKSGSWEDFLRQNPDRIGTRK
jgi:crossover junction endodeoxyribonuclease RuvC